MDKEDALRWAVQYGQLEVCKLLLEHGADVHTWNNLTLRYATYYGHLEVCKVLLEHGADVHACDNLPLIYAAMKGHLEVCKLLIEHGANINNAIKHSWIESQKEALKKLKKELKC